MENTQDFWQKRWIDNKTGWDIGYAAPPITDLIDTLTDKNIKILIPGAGNAYEAEYLFKNGFSNVYVMDIAAKPLENLGQRVPDFPREQLLNENFFEHTGQYDLIIEQTFFIAIDPALRQEYVLKMKELLKPTGHLTGLLIFKDEPSQGGPPYVDTKENYRKYFEGEFNILKYEIAENSIKPRAGWEVFIDMVKIV
ncbi:MAG: SAM-dependent methyltransferase [Ignavibacteria bacterium]|nr:SAM-dependent methyltransferase [Ignavibacteria bacterium]